ncbi:hypothetical protein SAMN04515667_1221 [Formosa sp. Hel1_31_208]|uniref:glutaredoxin family protein n=1 Tax=Formosa sp. Hel1_31_208 TaxID=1798225 RepID=UPI00087C56F0|nr:NrdH-redoxin [Formosa sp. Hel1_31_208]SDS01835.1 hypothetical protein SAMN04515667_1221 [Formosa sp. Hel1_31_208]
MDTIPKIKLFGTGHCHKTQFYLDVLETTRLPYEFLDVELHKDHAAELRGLYANNKLNFPTILIGSKKLRNPNKAELEKWLNKLIPDH